MAKRALFVDGPADGRTESLQHGHPEPQVAVMPGWRPVEGVTMDWTEERYHLMGETPQGTIVYVWTR